MVVEFAAFGNRRRDQATGGIRTDDCTGLADVRTDGCTGH